MTPVEEFNAGIDLFLEDGRLGLKYILLRLSDAGLTPEDQRNLRDLAVIACKDEDVAQAAERTRNAVGASQLAVAISEIVQQTRGEKKAAILGAIFGAHRSVGIGRDPVESAVAGAIAASAVALLDKQVFGFNLDRFLTQDV